MHGAWQCLGLCYRCVRTRQPPFANERRISAVTSAIGDEGGQALRHGRVREGGVVSSRLRSASGPIKAVETRLVPAQTSAAV